MGDNIIRLTHNLEILVCVTCGIMHAVPAAWLDYQRRDEDGEVHCPNGHVNCWPKDKDDAKPDDSPRVTELRKELVLAVHRAEQAEARARDEAALNDEQTAKATRTPGLAEAPAPLRDISNGWRVGCACCDSTYKFGHCLRKHLRRIHGWTEAQISAAFDNLRREREEAVTESQAKRQA